MELRHLRYFVAVAEELNFGRAARRLNMSQPPLSMQIKALEGELGAVLLDRGSHRTQLTPAGAAMLEAAYEVLNLVDLLPARVAGAASGERRTLSIGAVPTAVPGILPSVIQQFRKEHPGVQLQVREMNTREQLDALEAGALGVGLVRRGLHSKQLAQTQILSERLLLAVPEIHPWIRGSDSVRLSDLGNEDFIFFSREIGRWHFDELIRVCESIGEFTPRVAQQCHTVMSQLGLVSAGVGVGLVTELTRSVHVHGVRYVELSDVPISFPLIATWDDRITDSLRSEFVQMIARAGREIPSLPELDHQDLSS
ncbi:LysR family transcriptional regulator [Saccharopolyspora sp. ASAGF58]|uniref:LysR family transcriptional regulator n=1 Tax=Saccharopolyspora sp. ASAGF58 TaxID=2719023 RepID=UPI0014456344|nr:LysR substrate-binding domain-containing protein [Saccharopolyspora sp. ASAGF58]